MPSYPYAIVGARPEDGLDAIVDIFPKWREEVAKVWPELGSMALRMAPEGARSSEIAITVTDDITDAQALAYHTRTIFGAVQCVVERQMCLRYRVPLGPALLHEIAESGINPELNNYATVPLVLTAGGAPTMTTVMLEDTDPVTYQEWFVGGVQVCNVTAPRLWLKSNTGPLDVAGMVENPFPYIPKGGALMLPSGQFQYGAELLPDQIAHFASKRGRRWASERI